MELLLLLESHESILQLLQCVPSHVVFPCLCFNIGVFLVVHLRAYECGSVKPVIREEPEHC